MECYSMGRASLCYNTIAVMLFLKSSNHEFNGERFFMAFPVFRMWLFGVLLLWLLGFAIQIFERAGVNFLFLLDMDPRPQITASNLYAIASLASGVWLGWFACFLLDFKFGLFFVRWARQNSEKVTSGGDGGGEQPWFGSWQWLCCIYPMLLSLSMILFLALPHSVITRRHRFRLFWSLIKCLSAPSHHVFFAHIVAADVLTSMITPFKDFAFTLCFFGSAGHAVFEESFTGVSEINLDDHRRDLVQTSGTTCRKFITGSGNSVLVNLFLAYPFVIRLLQCLRKWRDEGAAERKQLVNAGKYLASLLVVVVATRSGGAVTGLVLGRRSFHKTCYGNHLRGMGKMGMNIPSLQRSPSPRFTPSPGTSGRISAAEGALARARGGGRRPAGRPVGTSLPSEPPFPRSFSPFFSDHPGQFPTSHSEIWSPRNLPFSGVSHPSFLTTPVSFPPPIPRFGVLGTSLPSEFLTPHF